MIFQPVLLPASTVPKIKTLLFFCILCPVFFLILSGCGGSAPQPASGDPIPVVEATVLGIAQDAGYPQADCQKACCRPAWVNPANRRKVSCLAISDRQAGKAWLLDATPDFPEQLQFIRDSLGLELGGILLTHAHIGHYTGLMYLGREVMGAKGMPVYVMPRMDTFLQKNGPWSQLVALGNIELRPMQDGQSLALSPNLSVTPFRVPHRDEFSETVGFSIKGPNQRLMFLPDIDKWGRWEVSVDSMVKAHDLAFLDATFYSGAELPGRDLSVIPHPFVQESLQRFAPLPDSVRRRIHFIHFNHSNPLLQPGSAAQREVEQAGFGISREGAKFEL
ncbi:MAG: MBL fold metallo-hydrolase [bacterium]|nr:MBL fold metallo-hydrolase [bacterium]